MGAATEASPILVIAPHPDDESLGCAGVIMHSAARGARVRVVYLTYGDGYPAAAALLAGKDVGALAPEDFTALGRAREGQAREAARLLGLCDGDLTFLGYPDAGLAPMLATTDGETWTQPFTRRSSTYGLASREYHSQVHGEPAPYTSEALVGDLSEVITVSRPHEIFVTDAADGHADHRAAFDLVARAARAASFSGTLLSYLVHSDDGRWPLPRGVTPGMPFEPLPGPFGVSWPPDERRPVSREHAARKLEAIDTYRLEVQIDPDYVRSFVKSEEVFWRREVR
jgi:LmbE family N-acetylglucosaminyl deacetylase